MSYQPVSAPVLVMRKGPQPNSAFLLNKEVITIGRALGNDLVVDDIDVSRWHARLYQRGPDWVLQDLGSTNGTFVNGQRLTEPVLLTPGTQVGFGQNVLFSLETFAAPPSYPPVPATTAPSRKGGFPWLLAAIVTSCVIVLALAALAAYLLLPRPAWNGTGLLSLAATMARGPDVALQEPANGTRVNLGEAVSVFAVAREEQGVTRLELWIDGEFVAQQDSPTLSGITPLSLAYTWAATTPGQKSLLVRAFNGRGAMGLSPLVYVIVGEEPAAQALPAQYVVQPGDTLPGVAAQMSTTVPALEQANPAWGETITPGQTIVVPVPPVILLQPPGQPVTPGADLISPQPQGQLPAQPPPPPNMPLKPPNLLSATPKDCKVALAWQDNSDNEVGFLVYRAVSGAPGFSLLPKAEQPRAGAGSQVQYTDEVPRPDTYIYYVTAINAAGQAASNLRMATVPPSGACIRPPGYRQVMFEPLTFQPTDPTYGSAAIYSSILGSTYRRIPEGGGNTLPVGNWSGFQQAAPVPASLYLNPTDPVLLSVSGVGWGAAGGQPQPIGGFMKAHPQSEMAPAKKWQGHGGDPGAKTGSDLEYRLWLENVAWGQGSTTQIPPPSNLRVAANATEMAKMIKCKTQPCDPAATRALVWDWSGDPTKIEGYLLYRSYSCPGQDAQIVAPEVVQDATEQGKVVPAWTAPSGCAARYQVSAFGPAGESAPSAPLDVPASLATTRLPVTFQRLAFTKPLPPATTGQIRLSVNPYLLSSPPIALQNPAYDLDKMALNDKMPNNAMPVNLGAGDSLQFGYEIVNLSTGTSMCKGQATFPAPAGNDWGKLSGTTHLLKDSNCELTVGIGKPDVLSVGQTARPQADLGYPPGPTPLKAIGKDVYATFLNWGPDDLSNNRIELTSYWVDPVSGLPVNKQTAVRWLSLPHGKGAVVWLKANTIPPAFVNLKPLPKLHCIFKPVDFDDPNSANNELETAPQAMY